MKKEIAPLDIAAIEKRANGNIYEAVVVIAQRARQINAKQKREISTKLAQFAHDIDRLADETNDAQTQVVQYYEQLPKPNLQAIDAFVEGDISYEYREEDSF